jgi:hypothetical protein
MNRVYAIHSGRVPRIRDRTRKSQATVTSERAVC